MIERIAIQGDKGCFHELAADKLFGDKAKELVYCKTFYDVFETLDHRLADYALVAISNNRYGDIDHVYHILVNNIMGTSPSKYHIVDEVYLKVSHCLLAIKGTRISDIGTVYSQAPAIVQCLNFIHNRLRNALVVEKDDTALSAELVSDLKSKSAAAIASKQAAKNFGLEILAEDIQEDTNNISRFVLVSLKQPKSYAHATKTALVLTTRHQTGDLAQALSVLADKSINLSSLESVPIPNRPFEYRYYLDIDLGLKDKRLGSVLSELNNLGFKVEVLGSYRQGKLPRIISSQGVRSW